MKRLREMTQAGDPMMKIRLPKALGQFIKDEARRSGRTHQDEVIKRIVSMFEEKALCQAVQAELIPELCMTYMPNFQAFRCEMNNKKKRVGAGLLRSPEFQDLVKYAQILPAEILQQMKGNADAHRVSLEIEVASLLMASFVEKKALKTCPLVNHILNYQFPKSAGLRELKENRQGWQYIFELQKLRLYLEMKSKLPRNFKQTFTLIDVKKESKKILEEMSKSDKHGSH